MNACITTVYLLVTSSVWGSDCPYIAGLIVHDTRFVATKLKNFYEEIYLVDRETIQKATKLPRGC